MPMSIKKLRKAFVAVEGEVFAGSDDDIRALIEGVDSEQEAVQKMVDWSEDDADENADEEENGGEPVDVNAANKNFAQAVDLAKVLVADVEFNQHIERVVEAGEEVKRGGVVAYFDLKRLFPGDKINDLPVPRTDKGNNPAKYRGFVPKPGGGEREGDRNKYKDMALQLPKVKAWNKKIADMRDAKANVEGCDRALQDLGPQRLESEIKRYSQRVTAAVSTLELGASIHFMLEEFRNFAGINVEFDYEMGKDGKPTDKVANTTTPIVVSNPHNKTQFASVSAKQFANLNVQKIKEGGGTFAAFLSATARKRTGNGGEAKTEEAKITVSTLPAFQTACTLLVAFIDDNDKYSALHAALNKKGKGADDLLNTIGEARLAFNAIFDNKPEYQRRFAAIQAAAKDEEKAA